MPGLNIVKMGTLDEKAVISSPEWNVELFNKHRLPQCQLSQWFHRLRAASRHRSFTNNASKSLAHNSMKEMCRQTNSFRRARRGRREMADSEL